MRPGRFLSELQRRHVLRVLGGYAVAAWLLVESYTTIQPMLWDGAEWTHRFVVILALLGVPVTFALAWVFDITPHGVRRTSDLDAERQAGIDAAPAGGMLRPRYAISRKATGFFGLGILVALVSFAAYAGYYHEPPGGASRDPDAPIESIAVLPFVDMSSARDQEFFSDGITEELLNRLAQVPDLHVAARTSSFAFKGRHDDVREIGRLLGVQAIVEGSVRREGDVVRVSTKLVDVATGYQIWGDSFDGGATDVFALQDQIAGAIVDALRQRFVSVPEAGRRGTTNARAHELYLLGLRRWNQRTDRDLRQALVYFEEATELDPQFALAWAGLAQTYAVLPVYGAFPVDTAVMRGSAAVAQALAHDASLAEAYAAMGQIVQNFDWDLDGAESYYKRALNYQPGDATAHQWYAETLALMGRYAEAERHSARVLATDPLSPTALYLDAFLRTIRGRAGEGLARWRDLARLHPDYEFGVLHFAYAAVAAGQPADMAAAMERLSTLRPARRELYQVVAATVLSPAGAPAARTVLARHAAELEPSERAAWHLVLGEADRALEVLAEAVASRDDVNLPYLLVHPLLAPLRSDERFHEIIAQTDLVVGG
ncbi:MAG TPA: tetratricopeptide repeat protein [Longimicrobiales bacterium]|nr:tetratricopeptide repeat protein [Longimicrobiales bacterium]